jgi:DNA-directed RNA polymerase specialized sigma24 family protein
MWATRRVLSENGTRIVTRLSQFDGRSKLKTWVYRIAVNYILDVKKSPVEQLRLSFEQFAEKLTAALQHEGESDSA